ncbi:hypothetical protein ACFOW1_11885 [Parasediminibacterium paludis]|uniref:Uncharacterized protein n=1 Tax=Parasediminibacterium paludis TaxID=908966 RepID=A0ABV8PZM9_9BACT
MVGKVTFINTQTRNFCIATGKGKCTICNASNINDIKVGDSIEFDNILGGSYFYNLRTERISASVVYWDINIGSSIEYCK